MAGTTDFSVLDSISSWFNGDDVACNLDKMTGGSSSTLTDQSAVVKAKALADYACKFYQAATANARANMVIALLQQAASFYFADKEHDVAKQAQNRFDEIWANMKDKADKLFSHWYDNSRPIEISMLTEAREREQKGYTVDYDTAMNRSVQSARREFGRAIEKTRRESSIHCTGATKTAIRQLRAAEARAAVLATNSAVRMEEERKHQRESQYREEVYKWNGLFQGRVSDSLNAIRTGQQAAAAASQINPYEGWARSVGQLSNVGNAYGNLNLAAFGANNAAQSIGIATGFL